MLPLSLGPDRKRLRVLCLGAHSDDIEIGCAGTLLRWSKEFQDLDVTWAVLCASDTREEEARRSAKALMSNASSLEIVIGNLEDAYLPADIRRAKSFLVGLRSRIDVDVILTHSIDDRHQDHRLIGELTWQTWRNHLVLEYEIPKFEGDLLRPNVLVSLPEGIAEAKINHLMEHFSTQRSKDWFSADTFMGLMRLRGIECRSESGFAEGFSGRKIRL
jgi:LmbE family N-acetylglucosaminyl deacetylase